MNNGIYGFGFGLLLGALSAWFYLHQERILLADTRNWQCMVYDLTEEPAQCIQYQNVKKDLK